jgi:two-component system chemotaxis response regulator CheV
MANMNSIDRMTALHKNNEVQYLCFRLEEGGELFAVNVFKVQEIIKYDKQPTLVDHEESALLEGLITVRDITVPLVDMKKWFSYRIGKSEDLRHAGLDPKNSQVMLCDFSSIFVGIRIYKADRILTKRWDEIFPSIAMGAESDKKISNHTYYIDGSLVQIVDIEKMISEVFAFLEEEVKTAVLETGNIDTDKFLLIAEDSVVATNVLKKILTKIGVKHRFFDNGRKLIEFIENNEEEMQKCALIITDLEMPEVSGFELIKRIKGKPSLEKIPIAVNSSMSGDRNRNMALSLGANHFIMQKASPIEISELVNKYFGK